MTLEEYCDRLVPHAVLLAGTVRDEGTDATDRVFAAVERLDAPVGVNPWKALAITLAAMLPQDRTPAEMLAWTRHLTPVPMDELEEQDPKVDWVKVEQIANGQMAFNLGGMYDKREVVKRLYWQGMNDCEIARRTRTSPAAILKQRVRMGLPSVEGVA